MLMHLRRLIFFLLLIAPEIIFGQDSQEKFVMAYNDYRKYLYLFNDGTPQQLESQEVRSFSSKGDQAAYVSSANNIIAYYDGVKTDLGDATGTSYTVTNELVYYRRDEVLGVFDKGKITRLSYFIKDFKVNEGLVVFRDQNVDVLKVYYKGDITELDEALIGSRGAYKAGKNTVAYMNSSGYFKAYSGGQIFELDNIAPVAFEAGKDIIAYVDGSQQTLNAFYNSKVLILEQIKPLSFQVGDELVAYITDEGFFKVFSQGKLLKVESYAPEFYSVNDASVLFFADYKLQLMLNGVRYELDEFIPKDYQMSRNSIAWKDTANRLHLFTEGKVHTVTTELFTSYELNGNILRYQLQDGTSRIYYKGKIY